MNYKLLNLNWNAEPNVPNDKLYRNADNLILEFELNYFIFESFHKDQTGRLTFKGCHKYAYGGTNDEGYFKGQLRYKNADLPYGDFYELETDWINDFPKEAVIIDSDIKNRKLKHYIFIMKENIFECVAEDYEFSVFN